MMVLMIMKKIKSLNIINL